MEFKKEKLRRVFPNELQGRSWVFFLPEKCVAFFDQPVEVSHLNTEYYTCYCRYGVDDFKREMYLTSDGFYDIPICDRTLRAFGFIPIDTKDYFVDLVVYMLSNHFKDVYVFLIDDDFKLSLTDKDERSMQVTVHSIREIQDWYFKFYGYPLVLDCMTNDDGDYVIPIGY